MFSASEGIFKAYKTFNGQFRILYLQTIISKHFPNKGAYGLKILTQLSMSYTNILTYQLCCCSLEVSQMLLIYFCRFSLHKKSDIHAERCLKVKMFYEIQVTYPVDQIVLNYLRFHQFPQNILT